MLHTPLSNKANSRDWYNPLRGMDLRKAVMLQEEARRGVTTEYLWTIDLVKQLDASLRGAWHSLEDGVTELDWSIKTKPDKLLGASQQAMAKRQADTLQAAYDAMGGLDEAIEHLVRATFYGHALCEIWRESAGGAITRLECVPSWHFHKGSGAGPWLYDADAALGSNKGVELPAGDWLIRNVADPVGPIALTCYVNKGFALKDWNGYSAQYGIPARWAVMPPNVAKAEEEAYMLAAAAAVSGNSGALPHGSELKFGPAATAGDNPFRPRLDYEDEQICLAVMSSMLTMLSRSGSGTLAGNAHAEALQTATRSLARKVSRSFRQLDKDILTREHPGEPLLAWWTLNYEQEASADAFMLVAKGAHEIGLQVDPEQVHERTGLVILDSPALPLSRGFAATHEQVLTAALDGV